MGFGAQLFQVQPRDHSVVHYQAAVLVQRAMGLQRGAPDEWFLFNFLNFTPDMLIGSLGISIYSL